MAFEPDQKNHPQQARAVDVAGRPVGSHFQAAAQTHAAPSSLEYDPDPDADQNARAVEGLSRANWFTSMLEAGTQNSQPDPNSSAIGATDNYSSRGDNYHQSKGATSGSYTPRSGPYPFLKNSAMEFSEDVPQGQAFNIDRAVCTLNANCHETTHWCRLHVLNAVDQHGYIRGALQAGHYDDAAKHISDVMRRDPRLKQMFSDVASGYGAQLDTGSAGYKAKVGDICVWEGGEWGHVMMCAGHRADGSPIWRADFTAKESNWTGLADANSHGAFHIYRQNTEEAKVAPNKGPDDRPTQTASAQDETSKVTGTKKPTSSPSAAPKA